MDNEIEAGNQAAAEKEKTVAESGQLLLWQARLLPWMIGLPTALVLLFIVIATRQFNQFNQEVNNYKNSELNESLPIPKDSSGNYLITSNIEYVKLYTLARMEEEAMNRRYSQGGVLLIARLYTQYLGFFTGMILAIVGSVFIISKLSENVSKLGLGVKEQLRLQLVSSSPGVIFAVLGTCLMLATILTHNNIDVKDMPLYLNYPALHQIQPSGGNGGKINTTGPIKNDTFPLP